MAAAEKTKEVVRNLVVGSLMGSADVVPGVSGGTVAFVCGIYARLVQAIHDAAGVALHLLKGDVKGAVKAFKNLDFLLIIPLFVGILSAVALLASVIEGALHNHPVELAGLFLGLVAGSVVIAWQQVHNKSALELYAIAAGVALFCFFLFGLRESTAMADVASDSVPLWAFPASAAIAICAMILPGISGSFLLVIMGMYGAVLSAATDRDFLPLGLFMLGAAVGLGLFSRLLLWLMSKHHDRVVAAMVGLMIGSLRILWPWPGGLESTELGAPSGSLLIPLLGMAIGFVIVVILGRLGSETVEHSSDVRATKADH